MLTNAIFYLILSFLIFLYISYKKIWPIMDHQIIAYKNKIKDALDALNESHLTLLENLANLKKDSETLPEQVRHILQSGQEKSEKLKESYNQNMANLMIERQDLAHKTMLKRQNKLENEFYFLITKEMQTLLTDWAKEQSLNSKFHHDSFTKSYSLLENRLKK